MSLKCTLTQKLKDENLSILKASKLAGISYPSFMAVLKGKAVPNAASLSRYAKFLGMKTEALMALAGRAPKKTANAKPHKATRGRKTAGRRKQARKPAPHGRTDDLAVLHAVAKELANLQALVKKAVG